MPPRIPGWSPRDIGSVVTTLCAGVKNSNTNIAVVNGRAVALIPVLGYGIGIGIGPTGLGIGVSATSGKAKLIPGIV